MRNIRTLGATLGAGVIILGLAGCADRNKNGTPESPATANEVSNAVSSAGDRMAPAANSAVNTAGKALDNAGKAISNAGAVALNTATVKTALGTNPGLKGSKIDVDTLPEKDSIALRGSVKTQAQKALAEKIAKSKAPGYKVVNQLKVG